MITLEEALETVRENVAPLKSETVDIAFAAGRILAEPIASDIDSPPFDKALMDGFAIRSQDAQDPEFRVAKNASATATGEPTDFQPFRLRCLESVTAGELPEQALGRGQCIRIMTGAPLPNGCDTVAMIERCEVQTTPENQIEVVIRDPQVAPERNVMRQAKSMQVGENLFSIGHRVTPSDVGLLAEVGKREVSVFRQPRAVVLATGNELVRCSDSPQQGKIRNSNGPMLTAALRSMGCNVVELPIGRDDPKQLESLIRQGLAGHLFVLSGGVSAGDLDLVPSTLAASGVEEVFHKVKLKPGKPILFGVSKTEPTSNNGGSCYVFGLPGNPVSSWVGLKLFVNLAVQRLTGTDATGPEYESAKLAKPFSHRGPRPTCWPSQVLISDGVVTCQPLDWKGSADQRTVAQANAMAVFPEGDRDYSAGELVKILR